jgi:ATP-dependent helicase YprA (DUF1998 family)
VERLMGHRSGLDSNYWRPTEEEILQAYLAIVPALTINDQNVESLKKHQEEKDKELEETKKQVEQLMEEQKEMRLLLGETALEMQNQFLKRMELIIQEKLDAAKNNKEGNQHAKIS